VRTSANTLDLRGERVDDALAKVDAFLDRLLNVGEPLGFVLHGHGTGALKSAVRAHLSASSYIERSEAADSESGGDAFTIFWVRW
jgi:DNA mismatch repair protein MutS2